MHIRRPPTQYSVPSPTHAAAPIREVAVMPGGAGRRCAVRVDVSMEYTAESILNTSCSLTRPMALMLRAPPKGVAPDQRFSKTRVKSLLWDDTLVSVRSVLCMHTSR